MIRHLLDILGIGWHSQIVLRDSADTTVHTRFYRPDVKFPPRSVMYRGSAYGDTGRYDSAGARIYRQNYGVYHYIPRPE